MALPYADLRNSDARRSILISEFDEIRIRQERRLEAALDSLEQSKKALENAMARVEMQEKEYTAVSEDVLRNLQALEMVIAMGKDGARQTIQDRYKPVEQPARTVPERIDEDPNVPGSTMFSGIVRKSRPLFNFGTRATQTGTVPGETA